MHILTTECLFERLFQSMDITTSVFSTTLVLFSTSLTFCNTSCNDLLITYSVSATSYDINFTKEAEPEPVARELQVVRYLMHSWPSG